MHDEDSTYHSLYGTPSQRQNQRCDDLDANVTQPRWDMMLEYRMDPLGPRKKLQRGRACEPAAAPRMADEVSEVTSFLA
jgi:hypothetical protein